MYICEYKYNYSYTNRPNDSGNKMAADTHVVCLNVVHAEKSMRQHNMLHGMNGCADIENYDRYCSLANDRLPKCYIKEYANYLGLAKSMQINNLKHRCTRFRIVYMYTQPSFP